MTKRLVKYVESKRKAWQHWPMSDWLFIELLAKELNIPQHEVLFGMKAFLTETNERKLEFRRFMTERLQAERSSEKDHYLPNSQRNIPSLRVERCLKCGIPGNAQYLKKHYCDPSRLERTKPQQQVTIPLVQMERSHK